MIGRGFNSPWTSSIGRLFDAVAALIGLQQHVAFEGQAAMELEWLATEAADVAVYRFSIEDTSEPQAATPDLPVAGWQPSHRSHVIDTRPMIAAIVNESAARTPVGLIARRFHNTLVEMIAEVCQRIRADTRIESVVLSGGVFQNALLSGEVQERLISEDFAVYVHKQVPANDGGLSLGQLAIAAAVPFRSVAETRTTFCEA